MEKKIKRTKKELRFEEVASSKMEQLKEFVAMSKYARTSGAFGGFGVTYEMLRAKGISEEVFAWLVANHFVNRPQAGRALWFPHTENKYHPTCTIANLEKRIKDFEEKLKK